MWKFVIKQDGLKVASGFAENKEDCIGESFHYLCIYAEESFNKMTMEVKQDHIANASKNVEDSQQDTKKLVNHKTKNNVHKKE